MNQRYEDERMYRGGYGDGGGRFSPYEQERMERMRMREPYEGGRTRGMMRGRSEESEAHDAPIIKVIEVLAESELGWEDAAARALHEASKSVRNIRSIYIKDMQASVRNGRITHFRVNAKISFAVEDEPRAMRGGGWMREREWS
jgi:flavin-binding protein dodecin